MIQMSELLEVGPWDIVLLAILGYLVYRFFFKKQAEVEFPKAAPRLPPLDMKDMTLEELRQFDGVKDERVLLAVCGNIYDVTRGKDFYGPGGAYENLAGHDATRALATFDAKAVKEEYDDWADLTQDDLNDAKEWDQKLRVKYDFIGKLLKPGESPSDYEGQKATVRMSF
ncbi:unnamed protein product [Bursaphelenchus okinawaensis]|uniref:Cytochrome b5 heme-binding domain-containing protein n=1 Tax=Bursaphelenchus okinawaensis TaxID=465554 RepID=A0A811KMD1_9BILA|nr:unnamed protein product [Bursaphelenchus okinawaensis]CAG9107635.1 unnamed protein product [Bursaphelenchus okinawaensis]